MDDANQSDDETVEFDIEVIASSSSVSLANSDCSSNDIQLSQAAPTKVPVTDNHKLDQMPDVEDRLKLNGEAYKEAPNEANINETVESEDCLSDPPVDRQENVIFVAPDTFDACQELASDEFNRADLDWEPPRNDHHNDQLESESLTECEQEIIPLELERFQGDDETVENGDDDDDDDDDDQVERNYLEQDKHISTGECSEILPSQIDGNQTEFSDISLNDLNELSSKLAEQLTSITVNDSAKSIGHLSEKHSQDQEQYSKTDDFLLTEQGDGQPKQEINNEIDAQKTAEQKVIPEIPCSIPLEYRLIKEVNLIPEGWFLFELPEDFIIEMITKAVGLPCADAAAVTSKEEEEKKEVREYDVDSMETSEKSSVQLDDAWNQQEATVEEVDVDLETKEQPQCEVDSAEIVLSECKDVTSIGLESVGGANVDDTTVELAQNEIAPKTLIIADPPQVILSGACEPYEASSDLETTSHSPLSSGRPSFIDDGGDEANESHNSLADNEIEDEDDLERELNEEPEFETRIVVVKRSLNPRQYYDLGSELGRGKFGTVFRCTEKSSGRQLAAKFISMRRREDREDVEREIAIMSALQHKRLLQLYDAFDDGHQEMCLITELVEGGELFERIVDDDFDLTERKAAIFMRQICEGVDYMHSQNIVHLDMKPENILCISKTGIRIKLIDFGLARRLDPNNPIRVMFGTPDFAAPEVLGYETVTLSTDMWSVGVICYVLLSGLSPFMGETDMETMANVTRATYDFNDQAFEPISDMAKDFIANLLLRDPNDRMKPNECLKHPWLQKGGAQLEIAVRDRRESLCVLFNNQRHEMDLVAAAADMTPPYASFNHHRASFGGESTTSSGMISLDKRRLKRYVVKRKWHKTVHAIMALNRMGANLNKFK